VNQPSQYKHRSTEKLAEVFLGLAPTGMMKLMWMGVSPMIAPMLEAVDNDAELRKRIRDLVVSTAEAFKEEEKDAKEV